MLKRGAIQSAIQHAVGWYRPTDPPVPPSLTLPEHLIYEPLYNDTLGVLARNSAGSGYADGLSLYTAASNEIRYLGTRRVQNLKPNSETPSSWVYDSGLTFLTGQSAPDGSMTAIRLTSSAFPSTKSAYENLALEKGRYFTGSIWVRYVAGPVSALSRLAFVGDSELSSLPLDTLSDGTWRRLAIENTLFPSSSVTNNLRFSIYLASGSVYDVWHPQIEDVTQSDNKAPSEYLSYLTGTGTEIVTDGSAAMPVYEQANTAGFTGTSLDVFQAQSGFTDGSVYAMEASSNVTSTGNARAVMDLDGAFLLTRGDRYAITFSARHVGVGGEWRARLSDVESLTSSVTDIATLTNVNTTFTTYTVTFVHSATTRYFGFMELSGGNTGGVYVDNLSIRCISRGAGVLGTQYIDFKNGNSVLNGVVTETQGDPTADQRGVLIEGQRTNSLRWTNEFTNALWLKESIAFTSGASGLDMRPVAALVAPNASLGSHGLSQTLLLTAVLGHSYSFSCYMKSSGHQYGILEILVGAVMYRGFFNLTGFGAFGTYTANTVCNIESLPDDWYRCTVTAVGTGTGAIKVTASSTPTDTVFSFSGDSVNGVIVQYPSLEDGSMSSSYIASGAAAATRVADVLQYKTSEYVFAIQGVIRFTVFSRHTHVSGQVLVFWGSYIDSNNSTSVFSNGTHVVFRRRILGVNYDASMAFQIQANTFTEIAVRTNKIQGGDIWVNGVKGANSPHTYTMPMSTLFELGSDGNGAQQSFCGIKLLEHWSTTMDDTQMASITAP